MRVKENFSVMFFAIFFVMVIIFGSNLAIERLEEITGDNFNPAFYVNTLEEKNIQIVLGGEKYTYSYVPVVKFYHNSEIYIQNFAHNVKSIMIPRIEYANSLWEKGFHKFVGDLDKYIFVLLK